MISSTIVLTDPDGSAIDISQLDNAIRLAKTEVSERMSGLIDTGHTAWSTTTEKEFLQGLARVYTGVADPTAAAGHTLKDGQLYIKTNADNTAALKAYYAAAWNEIKIGKANLLNDAVETAVIKDLNVTTGKIAAAGITAWQTEVSYTGADINDGANAVWGHTAKCAAAALTFTITPFSTASIVYCYLEGSHRATGGGYGSVRIFKSTAGATGTKQLCVARCLNSGTTTDDQSFRIAGLFTGENVAITVRVEVARSAAGATYHLDPTAVDATGVAMPLRFGAYEVKK